MRTARFALALAAIVVPPAAAQNPVVLRPADVEAGLLFGNAVSLNGTGLLVAAPGAVDGVSPRAYVFRSTPSGWVEEIKLEAPGVAGFASSVALSGNRAFVGAPGFVDSQSGNTSGAVFVFERTGGVWGAPVVLLPSDASTSTSFGHRLAADAGRLLVAGATRAYVFELGLGAWSQTAVLEPVAGTIADLDLSGERAVIGYAAPISEAFVLEHTPLGWDSGTKLNKAGGVFITTFGETVAIEGDRIAVLEPSSFCTLGTLHGYEWTGTNWHKSTILSSFADIPSAAIDQGRLALGSANALHVCRGLPSGGFLYEEIRHTPGMVQSTSGFPQADIQGHVGVLGTPSDDTAGLLAGGVRVWELNGLAGMPWAISVESGGTQELHVRRGASDSFSLYWIFGSATGTTPGLVVDGLPLPLNFDDYYLFLALYPNTVVNPTIGILDGQGGARPEISLPPLDPSLVGATLHHAVLTFDLSAAPFVDFASNAVPLRFVSEAPFEAQDFESTVVGWNFGGSLDVNWHIVDAGECGATSRMVAYTFVEPGCTGDPPLVSTALLHSSYFRLGEVGDYELRFTSRMTPGLSGRIRVTFGNSVARFELAWPEDIPATGVFESLSIPLLGVEYAVGQQARFEFTVYGSLLGSPAGWWIDDVEVVKLP